MIKKIKRTGKEASLDKLHKAIEEAIDQFKKEKGTESSYPVIDGKKYFLKIAAQNRYRHVKNEIDMLQRLSSIHSFYKNYFITSFEKDGKIGMLNRFIENSSDLTISIKPYNRLTLDDILTLYNSLLKKVKFFHDHSLTHGDIKAGNFLISNNHVELIDMESVNDFSDPNKQEIFYIKTKEYALPSVINKTQFENIKDAFFLYQYLDIYSVSLLILYIYNYRVFRQIHNSSGWNLCKRHPKKVVERRTNLLLHLLYYVFSFLPDYSGRKKITLPFETKEDIPSLDDMIYILDHRSQINPEFLKKISDRCETEIMPII